MGRMRSPNFPGLPLEDAAKFAKAIWDKNRRAEISREAAAKDLGYTGLTGRSLKVLGALNQYDLIENTAKGQIRVTKTAEDVFHGFPESVRLEALAKAGRSPNLYQSIYDKFGGQVPGENAVKSFLFQSGFTNEGVDKALRNFLETNRYLEISGASESYGDDDVYEPDSAPGRSPSMEKVVVPEGPQKGIDAIFWNKDPLDFNLSSSGLAVAGRTNSAAELRTFIDKLKTLLTLLPEPPAEAPSQEHDL